MILRLFRRERIEAPPNNVEDIVLGGVAIAERYLDRGNMGEAYRMLPHLERLHRYDGIRDTALLVDRDEGLNRVVMRIANWKYDPEPDPTLPDAA